MAEVVSRAKLHQRITDYLDYLESEWQSLPQIAREWNEWADYEQLDFVVEWPIREDRLNQLAST